MAAGTGAAPGLRTMSLRIEIDEKGLAAFCRRSRIRRLSFFGSVLRDVPESARLCPERMDVYSEHLMYVQRKRHEHEVDTPA